jgi:hypothetical protein
LFFLRTNPTIAKYWNQNKADIEYFEMNDVNMLSNGQAPAHYVE